MTDFQARPCRPEDAAAVADIVNAAAEAGGMHGGFGPADLEAVLTGEIRDLTTDSRLVSDAAGRPVAVALVPGGSGKIELIGGVHPAHRGHGLGRDLLAWQLRRATELAPPGAQASVIAGAADTTAPPLFQRLGFVQARHFLEMSAPTTPSVAVPLPSGLRIAPFQEEQERQLYLVHNAAFHGLWAFQERTFEAWSAATVRAATFQPGLARLALTPDGTIAGYVLPYKTATPGRCYIGQVGTAPEHRRRGIAAALLAGVLAAAAAAGYERAGLDTDAENPTGAAGVYRRVGFEVDQHVVAYRRPLSP